MYPVPVSARFKHFEDAVESCETEGKDAGLRMFFVDWREKVHRYDWLTKQEWDAKMGGFWHPSVRPLFLVGDEKIDRIRKVLSVMGHRVVTIKQAEDLISTEINGDNEEEVHLPVYVVDGIYISKLGEQEWEVGYDHVIPATRWEPEDADYVPVGTFPSMEKAVIEAGMMLHRQALDNFFMSEYEPSMFDGLD